MMRIEEHGDIQLFSGYSLIITKRLVTQAHKNNKILYVPKEIIKFIISTLCRNCDQYNSIEVDKPRLFHRGHIE